MDGGRREYLIEGVDVVELGVGVLGRVEVVYAGDFGEVDFISAVSGERQLSAWTNFWPRVRRNEARCTSPCILYLHYQTFARPLVRPFSPSSLSSSPPMSHTDPPYPYRKTADSPETFSQNPL